jgi:hypothetical protein
MNIHVSIVARRLEGTPKGNADSSREMWSGSILGTSFRGLSIASDIRYVVAESDLEGLKDSAAKSLWSC